VPSVVVADEPRSVGDLIECFFCVHGVGGEIRPSAGTLRRTLLLSPTNQACRR
jgi:hypothetical protein